MNIILKDSNTDTTGATNWEMECGKKAAFISENKKIGYINVCCKNATHKVYRGVGRIFWNGWEEAKTAYKSPEMRAMIGFAADQAE